MSGIQQVAATMQEDYADWPDIKGIQLEGDARRVAGVEQFAAIALYGLKFPIIPDLSRAPQEIVKAMSDIAWYRLTPIGST
jgi:uncharacterized protein YhbP (UPF0306 family)